MSTDQLPAERYLRFHRRQMFLYLLGCTAMAVFAVVAAIMPGENPSFVGIPTVALFGLMIVMGLLERARHRAEFAREAKRIWSDEWTLRGMNRAKGQALLAVIFAQVPLTMFMSYVPEKPSVGGMGIMTVALGCGTMAASFLYHTREPR